MNSPPVNHAIPLRGWMNKFWPHCFAAIVQKATIINEQNGKNSYGEWKITNQG